MCILLVEDEFLIRAAAQFVLEDAGYEVLDAEHGEEACDYLDQHPGRFTCLVTDYHMPGAINGEHLIVRMRETYPTTPMILASAFPQATFPEWRELYAVSLLVKPYELDELVRMVRMLMR